MALESRQHRGGEFYPDDNGLVLLREKWSEVGTTFEDSNDEDVPAPVHISDTLKECIGTLARHHAWKSTT
jgi:hypothetical protein